MNPGDRVRIHMHDTPDGLPDRPDRPDDRRERLDDRLGRQRLRPHPLPAGLGDLPDGAVRLPPGVLDRATRAATRGRRTPTTSRCPTRSGTSRTAASSTPNFNCAKPGDQDKGAPRRGRRQQLLRPGRRLDAREDQRVLQRRRGLRRAVVPARLAGHDPRPAQGREAAPVAGPVHEPAGERDDEVLDHRVRGRPAADRGRRTRRTTRRSATGRPARTASTRPQGAQFYPFYTTGMHDGTCTWQQGGNFIPGTIEPLRRQLDDRVRAAAATVYPDAGFTTIARDQQLQQRGHAEPLPGDAVGVAGFFHASERSPGAAPRHGQPLRASPRRSPPRRAAGRARPAPRGTRARTPTPDRAHAEQRRLRPERRGDRAAERRRRRASARSPRGSRTSSRARATRPARAPGARPPTA